MKNFLKSWYEQKKKQLLNIINREAYRIETIFVIDSFHFCMQSIDRIFISSAEVPSILRFY